MKQNRGVDEHSKAKQKAISTSHTCSVCSAWIHVLLHTLYWNSYHGLSCHIIVQTRRLNWVCLFMETHIYHLYIHITLSSALMKLLWLMGQRDQCRVCQNASELWPSLPFHNEYWHRKHRENIKSVWLTADLQYRSGQDMTCNTDMGTNGMPLFNRKLRPSFQWLTAVPISLCLSFWILSLF